MDIVVLCGGLSTERDVSLSSGAMVSAALGRLGHRVVKLDLFFGCTDEFRSPEELFAKAFGAGDAIIADTAPDLAAIRAARSGSSRIGDNVLEICRAADLVFIALHGEDGEDGKIQSALDLLGVKYTGTGSLGSALALNKSVAKDILSAAGVSVPQGILLHRGEAISNVGFPCVVKPCSGGSSVGTSIVEREADFAAAVAEAFVYDSDVIVEQFVAGRECSVGVMNASAFGQGDGICALPVIEICPKEGFYDYKNKYQAGFADEFCPADFAPDVTERLQRAAEAVFRALRLEVYSRIDFIVTPDGAAWCLEANTLPGMTPTSLLPQEAAAAGLDYDELVTAIVRESLKKYGA